MKSYVVLVDCPDRKGIVHHVTGVLFKHGLNVEDQGEFVDREEGFFFMRTEVSGMMKPALVKKELEAVCPSGARVNIHPAGKKKVIVFATKEPHCLGDLLLRHEFGELNAEIKAVICNNEKLRSLVEKFSIPCHVCHHEGLSRDDHEKQIISVLKNYKFDYIVLAKYMRVLSPEFVGRYEQRMVNIHHSFLPAFAGANPYKQAFERGVKIIGATAHFVTAQLDEGPIIAQQVIGVDHSKNAQAMRQAGRDVEQVVLATALRLVFEDRVFIHKNRTIIFD